MHTVHGIQRGGAFNVLTAMKLKGHTSMLLLVSKREHWYFNGHVEVTVDYSNDIYRKAVDTITEILFVMQCVKKTSSMLFMLKSASTTWTLLR